MEGMSAFSWIKSVLPAAADGEATVLRVRVTRGGETKVDLSMPARCARWLAEVIPGDVAERIRAKGVPLDEIQSGLAKSGALAPQKLFTLEEPERTVSVWLE